MRQNVVQIFIGFAVLLAFGWIRGLFGSLLPFWFDRLNLLDGLVTLVIVGYWGWKITPKAEATVGKRGVRWDPERLQERTRQLDAIQDELSARRF
jgi:hypothetical protein